MKKCYNIYTTTAFSRLLPVVTLMLSLVSLCSESSYAQIVRAGFKIGGQLNKANVDDVSFKDTVNTKGTKGYDIGLVFSFKVRNRYFLHTEYLYSVKSKYATGKLDRYLKDRATYRFIEVPVLFSMHFKGKLGENQNFKWYGGIGPNITYLLGGKGALESGELLENGIEKLHYKIKFGERPDRDHIEHIYYKDVNRFQFGINIGGGVLLEPAPKQKLMIDFRYTFNQTLFAKSTADYLAPVSYNDNLRFRNKGIRISVMYLLEYNLNKKERNKGKSNIRI